jgi:hypothetical protein
MAGSFGEGEEGVRKSVAKIKIAFLFNWIENLLPNRRFFESVSAAMIGEGWQNVVEKSDLRVKKREVEIECQRAEES